MTTWKSFRAAASPATICVPSHRPGGSLGTAERGEHGLFGVQQTEAVGVTGLEQREVGREEVVQRPYGSSHRVSIDRGEETTVTELYLIRHGQSVANVTPVVGGMRGDAGLTDLGREQARLLEERLRAEEFGADVLYTSTLPSAMASATVGSCVRP